jgi:aminoglycoside phosphotransferase (APT) family kinase protein
VGVLDWEMATIGDPLMDLGSTLGYWVDADDPEDWQKQSFGLTTRPGNLNREQLVEHYLAKSGRPVGDPVFYFTYGLFKIAVIVQQIYARYQQGLTQDARFAGLINLVRSASNTACLAIEKRRITRLATN